MNDADKLNLYIKDTYVTFANGYIISIFFLLCLNLYLTQISEISSKKSDIIIKFKVC